MWNETPMNAQYSTSDQLAELALINTAGLKGWSLYNLANQHGLYDAADVIARRMSDK